MKYLAALLITLFLAVGIQAKKEQEFPLTIHITSIDAHQGVSDVSGGSGYTDQNGNYSQSGVSGGGTYVWHAFSVRIDGDPKLYQFRATQHVSKKAKAAIVGSMGYGALFMRRSPLLQIGDYHARWNKNGQLEVEYIDGKGKSQFEVFHILTEDLPQQQSASAN